MTSRPERELDVFRSKLVTERLLASHQVRSHGRMDEDLANIIRQALDEAKAARRDDTGQTEHAVRKVRELRPDMMATYTLNAINLVRSFL